MYSTVIQLYNFFPQIIYIIGCYKILSSLCYIVGLHRFPVFIYLLVAVLGFVAAGRGCSSVVAQALLVAPL